MFSTFQGVSKYMCVLLVANGIMQGVMILINIYCYENNVQ